jgi:hypothetical protein
MARSFCKINQSGASAAAAAMLDREHKRLSFPLETGLCASIIPNFFFCSPALKAPSEQEFQICRISASSTGECE